ncbi:uncharacterized protein V6R79_024280 [Siganus canaliculatus]
MSAVDATEAEGFDRIALLNSVGNLPDNPTSHSLKIERAPLCRLPVAISEGFSSRGSRLYITHSGLEEKAVASIPPGCRLIRAEFAWESIPFELRDHNRSGGIKPASGLLASQRLRVLTDIADTSAHAQKHMQGAVNVP